MLTQSLLQALNQKTILKNPSRMMEIGKAKMLTHFWILTYKNMSSLQHTIINFTKGSLVENYNEAFRAIVPWMLKVLYQTINANKEPFFQECMAGIYSTYTAEDFSS